MRYLSKAPKGVEIPQHFDKSNFGLSKIKFSNQLFRSTWYTIIVDYTRPLDISGFVEVEK
jgi:hypothetical protein